MEKCFKSTRIPENYPLSFVFNSKDEALILFYYINCRHQNIKFTIETEVDGIISILDVLINDNSYFTLGLSQINLYWFIT